MKKLLFVLTIAFLMLIAVNIVNLFAEPKPQEGNPGLPGCLAQVDQLQQTIADQQATIAEQEATILALQEQIATLTTSLEYALPKTGITASSSPGDDGALQKGVSWPNPRFTDNGDGTITDNLTQLVWLQNATCGGTKTWEEAITYSNNLHSGMCGLNDTSEAGDWRLPNIWELVSLIHWGVYNPALPNTTGTGQLAPGDPFWNVETGGQCFYFSSTTYDLANPYAWTVPMSSGGIVDRPKATAFYFWPVRDAK